MRFYNTLSRKVEEFIPIDNNVVKVYTCGPTVYHYAHIGNIRNYIGHDIFHKTLLYLGYKVERAMNITDVGHLTSDSDSGEDKMIAATKREGKSAMEVAEFYTKAFFDDFNDVNCRMPEVVSPATENIDMYIKMITKLLDKDYAYISGGNIYFDVSKLDDYYKLTNHKIDEMVVGVREGVEEDDNKRNQADFALWFTSSKYEHHELLWDSPWGRGYPGWHIECSGIAIKYLGEYLDVHGGGVDNIFPHHTNEIAQSEGYLGHEWCKYWFHNEHLIEGSGKMSKSKGEFLTISLLKEKGYDPLAFRFMCLNSHYRKQLLFTYDGLDQAQNTLNKLRSRISSISEEGTIDIEKVDFYNEKFKNYLEDDLNTANALSVLFDVLKDNDLNGSTKLKLVSLFDEVFSLDLNKPVGSVVSDEVTAYIEEQIEARSEAKKNKNYEKADQIRNNLSRQGIELKDTREKTLYVITDVTKIDMETI